MTSTTSGRSPIRWSKPLTVVLPRDQSGSPLVLVVLTRITGQGGGDRGNKGPRQPDPMQTSVGYIGADAYWQDRWWSRWSQWRWRWRPWSPLIGAKHLHLFVHEFGFARLDASRFMHGFCQSVTTRHYNAGFVKSLDSRRTKWLSNAPCRSSNPMPWLRTSSVNHQPLRRRWPEGRCRQAGAVVAS